ncbi:rhomboid family intramembrane serine protease [Spongiivirga citrea]|uniref:Rhomboid family intramembrane serine protease n=1 Tax=Spongiivirga citrea TaxID=1481457 RepID=A0A6M0CEH0_9FLAO|nr:rhomboid family intramembrane serine protease [Spongiivirga citrea]NER16215.1 rhomboid family intramembrane serine protease [Spongiivirga citrea]
MKQNEPFQFTAITIAFPMLIVLAIWVVYYLELRFSVNLSSYGVQPRTLSGLSGVVFSPFLHSSLSHLYHNTIPLFLLSLGLFYFYRSIAVKVLILGILVSGLLTWLIGRPANHIGASGLIYVLVSFIFFKGVRTKYYRLIALSLVVVFIYGSMIWYIFPVKENMSWEGHLAGLITGIALAFLINARLYIPKRYHWEQDHYKQENDPFLKHFDEEGNFVPSSEMEKQEESEEGNVKYVYNYIDKKSKSNLED